VRFSECESELLIPNVFTPDGDGINDRFEVRGILPHKWRLQVYNRYGQAVFKSMGTTMIGWRPFTGGRVFLLPPGS
jgi:gliding motility-associated-like protein